ncbi:FtsX-like permease family protein [Kitasatospora sp. NBC_00240]|uniref:ABC transporter permease n=1 Tax=Kitasatospora sp. NBC_00240 TaxID=2903567 RepID=UPI002252792F|nr:FtsX-like permease family protein [Kitasatospora sp. NBC_00240]MCX5212307.1 FtsX-like permease family protein [Kitasatospora sp. NBC_00240]
MRMTRIALKSLRARWTSLTGAFVALALGVALTAAMTLGLAGVPALPPGEDAVVLYAVLGTASGVSTFVSAFVVASTYAYVVAQRRRELGLLRLAGATPAQVRRTVLAEALLLGVAASAAGCAAGRAGAPRLAGRLVAVGMAPPGFTAGTASWPLYAAFTTGLLVALGGVAVAARRAGRIGPLDALREADVDTGVMTAGRWVWAVGLLVTAAAVVATALATDPGRLLARKTYTTQPMLLISACALLTPVTTPPLLRVLAWLPARLTRYAGRLARESATAGLRRTGAIAAPVLVSVALAGSLAGALQTVSAAKAAEARSQSAADYVVTPGRGTGAAGTGLLDALRAVPGLVLSPTAGTRLSVVEPDGAVVAAEARTADPAALAVVSRLPVLAGSVAALDDDGIVLPEEWPQHGVGQRVPVVRPDGSRTTLRVAAVLRDGMGNNGLYVTARNAPGARVDRVDVRLLPGADPAATDERLRAQARAHGATVATRDAWLAAAYPADNRTAQLRSALVLGLALLYTGIALANTLVMATTDRGRELAVLRLTGATRGQVVGLVTAESLLVVAAGTVLGCAVAGLNLAGMHGALALLGVSAPVPLPWGTVGVVAGAAAVITVPCAALSAAWVLRGRPVAAVAR